MVRYDVYGGAGIIMCDAWRDSFNQFMVDMGPRPSPKHILSRCDDRGNYEPSNCVWAPRSEMAPKRNKTISCNYQLTYRGETLSIAQWSKRTGLSIPKLRYRVLAKWPIERVFSGAISAAPSYGRYTYWAHGRCLSMKEWSVVLGVPVRTLQERVTKGIPFERAFTAGSLRKK